MIQKNKKALMGLGVVLLVCVTAAFAAVNVKGAIVNALSGFQYNTAAPSNHVLCGNGTVYVDCSAAPKATALATAPVQCSGGTPLATGIAANGDANCTSSVSYFSAYHDVTGSRAWGTVYHNTTGLPMDVDGYGSGVAGGSTNNINCLVGTTSSPTTNAFNQTNGATVAGGAYAFRAIVPNNDYYECSKTNDLAGSPTAWIETY